jgi:hypothetical protein
LEALRSAMHKAFAQIGPGERQKILERTRLIISVPALRSRLYDGLVGSIEMLADVFALRAGRSADDLAVRAFAGACIGAVIAAVLEWAGKGGADDLGDVMDQALAVLESGLS